MSNASEKFDRLRAARLRAGLLRDLSAAVEARARARKHRQPVHSLAFAKRIKRREAACLAHLDAVRTQTQVLIADPVTLERTMKAIEAIENMVRMEVEQRSGQADQVAHRPTDEQFRADCQAAMARHSISEWEVATIIVEQIAPNLSEPNHLDLLGPGTTKAEQIHHLTNRLRNRL